MASRSTVVDPRAWNLLAGLSLVALGCGGRTLSATESGSESTTSNPETGEGSDNECFEDEECPPGYYCVGGMCEYQIAPDGGPWYECYSLDECGSLALCVDYICESVPGFAGCEPTAELTIPLAIDGQPLGLSFVDVDDDGADELVVATQAELHVFESGSDVASVSARTIDSQSLRSMVAGDFDPGPGEDLTLLDEADMLIVHPSNGVDGFASPSASPSPLAGTAGLVAGEFDGAPGSDRLIWGQEGAVVDTGSDSTLPLTTEPIEAASARMIDSGRFVLRVLGVLRFTELDGGVIAEAAGFSGAAGEPVVSLVAEAEHLELGASVHGWNPDVDWTLLQLWDLASERGRWGIDGAITAMVAGDLDGEGRDEIALISEGVVWLLDNMGSGSECILSFELGELGTPVLLSMGDWDGDGDKELALAAEDGTLAIFDGG